MFSCSAVFLPKKGNDEQRLHLGILSSLMLETHLAFGKRVLRQGQNVSNGHHLHKDSSTTSRSKAALKKILPSSPRKTPY